jgi:predicted RNA-binding protein with PUA-like domain
MTAKHKPSPQTWLMKSEPDVFSIDDLARRGQEPWNGVRNYQARNFLRDSMREGDLAIFYHSNAKPPGAVGVMRVASGPEPDPTALDPRSEYYDASATRENPRWFLRRMDFVAKFARLVPLAEIQADATLAGILVAQRGQRLSVQPLSAEHFQRLCELGA